MVIILKNLKTGKMVDYKIFCKIFYIMILVIKISRLDHLMMTRFVKLLNLPQRYTLSLQSPAIFSYSNIQKFKRFYFFNSKTIKNFKNSNVAIYESLELLNYTNFFLHRTLKDTYFYVKKLNLINVSLSITSLLLIISRAIEELNFRNVTISEDILFSTLASQIPKAKKIILQTVNIKIDKNWPLYLPINLNLLKLPVEIDKIPIRMLAEWVSKCLPVRTSFRRKKISKFNF